jgi:hypothetical protein
VLVLDDAPSGPKRDASVVAAEAVGALLLAAVCSATLYLGLQYCIRMGWVSLREGKLCCCQVLHGLDGSLGGLCYVRVIHLSGGLVSRNSLAPL